MSNNISNEGLNFAVVGATGAVGREMISVLSERRVPIKNLKLLASERSAGEEIEFNTESGTKILKVETLTKDSFANVDVALFSAGGDISKEFGPIAVEQGAIVIDNSSAFRMVDQIPLVVPEVNADLVRQELSSKKGFLIANPNCSTIQLVVILKPIHEAFNIKRVVVSTYQSVSGAGKKGIDELSGQVISLFNQQDLKVKQFPHQIAFNCIPQIDVFTENGYTKEEMKVINESRKILGIPQLKITATAVRVPVFNCHAESVNIETELPIDPAQCREVLVKSPGVIVEDSPKDKLYPLNIALTGSDASYVGRIRKDESVENGVNLWVVADNLRKGAALNAVQIAEIVVNTKLGTAH